MTDVLVIGGGVIGLSLAYELAGNGLRVRVIDAGQPGREASWAGAGILPPASAAALDPFERLTALSNELHRHWSEQLRRATSIDNGYRRSGAIYLARDAAETARLEHFARLAHARRIVAERLAPEAVTLCEPSLQPKPELSAAYLVPDECQIRNPRHLKALMHACGNRGVEITPGAAADDFDIRAGRVRAIHTGIGVLAADQVCLTAGSWSGSLARRLGVSAAIRPIRGQMILLSSPKSTFGRILNEGSRYLVPRGDGRVLVGSTEEDAGFDRSTTAGAISGLLEFAFSLVPELADATVERTWAGLRPSTIDGLPYLGRMPGLDNVVIAAGHFRGGLQLSTGTALVMSQLLRGEEPEVDLTPFRMDRHEAHAEPHALARRATPKVAATPGAKS